MSGTTQGIPLDERLMKVTFDVDGALREFDQRFAIRAKGAKYANSIMNECTVEISGLSDNTRNYILTETSPFNKNRTAKTMTLYAGRISTGLSMVYQGDIVISNVGAPPEIALTLKCGTGHFQKGKLGTISTGGNTKISIIASRVAKNIGVTVNNQATDKTVTNYVHSGNALDEIVKLQELGPDVFLDDTQLILKNATVPLSGDVLNLTLDTGLLGVPNVSEQGLKVMFLYTPTAKLGGAINITSKINPACNGLYVIYKLNFALASREHEFQYVAECLKTDWI